MENYRAIFLTGTPLKVLSVRLHSKSHQKSSKCQNLLTEKKLEIFRGVPVKKITLYQPLNLRPNQRFNTRSFPHLIYIVVFRDWYGRGMGGRGDMYRGQAAQRGKGHHQITFCFGCNPGPVLMLLHMSSGVRDGRKLASTHLNTPFSSLIWLLDT